MGLLDAATGMFIELLSLPLFQHDMRSAIALHPMLQNGDILLRDRAFCSFAHVALLQAQGVHACFRQHQRRKSQGRRGSDRWDKTEQKPSWMTREQFACLPAFVDVRLVSYTVTCRGRRTVRITIATTLMDERQWPDDRIRELYGQRWVIETCFNHLKTTMRANVLRCKSANGVMKELAMMLIAYNMIRLLMLQAAARQGIAAGRISFIDAMTSRRGKADGPGGRRDVDRQPAQSRPPATARGPTTPQGVRPAATVTARRRREMGWNAG